MKYLCGKPLILAASLLTASAYAGAQEAPIDFSLKLRAGLQVGNLKDHLSNRLMGFGCDAGLNTSLGRFGVELGWSYKPGDQYLADTSAMPTAAGMAVIPGMAVDSRKNTLEGFEGRITYEKVLVGDLGIVGGLQIGGTKYTQEYIADIQGAAAPVTAASTATFRDTYNGTPAKNKVSVSPFVGLTYRFTPNASLELNVLALRYTAYDYVHQAGYTAGLNRDISRDYTNEDSRVAPHIELGYVFRF